MLTTLNRTLPAWSPKMPGITRGIAASEVTLPSRCYVGAIVGRLARSQRSHSYQLCIPRMRDAAIHIKANIRQQVDLVDQHQPAGAEHVRILLRPVIALGDRQHHHLGALAEV